MRGFFWQLMFLCSISISQQLRNRNYPTNNEVVIVQKAKGRIGNHLWLLLILMNYELKFGVNTFITEQSRWILDKYFKGNMTEGLQSKSPRTICYKNKC